MRPYRKPRSQSPFATLGTSGLANELDRREQEPHHTQGETSRTTPPLPTAAVQIQLK
jgi:hypothetical protein